MHAGARLPQQQGPQPASRKKELTMKAIRIHAFGGPEAMQLEELPDLAPGPGQVVVRARAIGVNPVDTYIRSGAYARKPSPMSRRVTKSTCASSRSRKAP